MIELSKTGMEQLDAVDAHCHIFGPRSRFPYPGERVPDKDWSIEDLEDIWDSFGFQKAVLVQTKMYGNDHSAVLNALSTRPNRYRAVVLPGLLESSHDQSELDELGVRAVRFHFMDHLGAPDDWNFVEKIAERLSGTRWHLEFHLTGKKLVEIEDQLRRLPVPYVVDHMGRIGLGRPESYEEIACLIGLLQTGQAWTKLSGGDRCSAVPGQLNDAVGLMKILLASAPDRVVWGMDHPHPNSRSPLPSNNQLVDALLDAACGSDDVLRRVLHHNPMELYRWNE